MGLGYVKLKSFGIVVIPLIDSFLQNLHIDVSHATVFTRMKGQNCLTLPWKQLKWTLTESAIDSTSDFKHHSALAITASKTWYLTSSNYNLSRRGEIQRLLLSASI